METIGWYWFNEGEVAEAHSDDLEWADLLYNMFEDADDLIAFMSSMAQVAREYPAAR